MGFRSLAFKLAVNVLVALTVCFLLLVALVVNRADRVSSTIQHDSLETHLEAIVDSIRADRSGGLELALPEPLGGFYASASRDHIYIVKSSSGGKTWMSHPELAQIAEGWTDDDVEELIVKIDDVFGTDGSYHGIAREFETEQGRFVALTAQSGGQIELAGLLMSSFVKALCDLREDEHCREFSGFVLSQLIQELRWIIPLFIVLLVGTVVVTIHLSLRPLSVASKQVASIDPNATNVRLDSRRVPGEISPVVDAVNGALDRLEAGYSAERRFTANAAHELRTPLSILKANIDRLAHHRPGAEQRALEAGVARMTRVVEQLLSVARLEMPQARQHQRLVMNALVCDTVAALAPLAIARSQTLSAELPETPVACEGDRAQLEEALKNLIENAIVHCPTGTSIEVELCAGGEVRVRDNGSGVAPESRARLFERFFRADRSTTGAGLGLAIARDIAQQHGGNVRFEETPGGGATFVLTVASVRS